MNNTLIKIFFFCLAFGHGISKADEAGFIVISYSPQDNGNQLVFPCPYNNMVRSSFSGFHKGIYSFAEGHITDNSGRTYTDKVVKQ